MGFSSIGPGLDRLAVPLIHLTGLDVRQNAIHKCIHDTFRSSQSAPVNFTFVPLDQSYPVCKRKKENLDLYLPDGALKIDWMTKQLEQIPAVLCFFVDLEFDDPNMGNRLQEIKSKLDILRQSLENRKTTISVCLLQNEAVDNTNLSEIELTIGVSRTNTFILPIKPDHLSGYVQRLQAFLLQLSHNYYDAEIMEVKMKQEMNASRMHPLLYCRYLFKLAFYCEIRRTMEEALTFYKHCYSRLTSDAVQIDIRSHSQVRAFATLVNFKLIKIYLTVAPYYQRDFGLKQLARHIEFWTRNQGPPELGFEHFAWVANQNRVYADLLSETTHGLRVNGQAAFYFLKAAKFEKDRANFIRQIKAQVLQQKCPANDITARSQTYFGERTWRDTMNSELIQQNELIAMFILQHKECHVDHSLQITKTLNKANAEFKNVGYSRFRPHLLIMMVEEYLRTDDKEAKQRALTLIYKCYELLDSSWKDIHIKCHELMYKCATDLSDQEKTMIALINLLGEESIQKETKIEYFEHFQSLKNSIQLIVPNLSPDLMIFAKFKFSQPSYRYGDEVKVNLDIRNNSPAEISIDKISGSFNMSNFNQIIAIPEPILIAPESTKSIQFRLKANSDLSEKILVLEEINLYCGGVVFQIDRNRLPVESGDRLPMTSWISQHKSLHIGPVEKSRTFAQSCKILPPKPKAKLEFENPKVLHTGEILEITLDFDIFDDIEGDAKITIQTNKESLIERSKQDLLMKDPCQHLNFENLKKCGKISFWIKHTGQIEQETCSLVVANLTYRAAMGGDSEKISHSSSKRAELRLPLVKPVRVGSKCATDLFRPLLATPPLGHSILSLIKVESVTSIPIKISKICFSKTKYLETIEDTENMDNLELNQHDSCQAIFFLRQTGERDENSASLDLSKIQIYWSRSDVPNELFSHTAPLGYLPVTNPDSDKAIKVKPNLPSEIKLHQPFNLELSITNVLNEILTVNIALEENQDLKLASAASEEFHLLPEDPTKIINIVLIPMKTTWITLPKVTLNYTTGNGLVSSVQMVDDLPRALFVASSSNLDALGRIIHSPIKI